MGVEKHLVLLRLMTSNTDVSELLVEDWKVSSRAFLAMASSAFKIMRDRSLDPH